MIKQLKEKSTIEIYRFIFENQQHSEDKAFASIYEKIAESQRNGGSGLGENDYFYNYKTYNIRMLAGVTKNNQNSV